MKKTNTLKAPLKLETETVVKLTTDMLRSIAGGMIAISKQSHCVSACWEVC